MTRFIALLRGVNVGGRTIKSAELADVFRGLGYDRVKTVLASGNVVFTAEGTASAARIEIEKALAARFAYDAKVHVLDTDALTSVIDAYPFSEREGWHRYVVFLIGAEASAGSGGRSKEPSTEADAVAESVLELELDPKREEVADGGPVVFWTVERGHTLDSVVGKRLGRGKDKDLTTTRNLNTLRKLL
ncbi:DUF1697 domain-containing protein [Planctomonas sp. JC2975]|uniref:DUF1697 domain-containing protein n=1 Tax=Planctomonas sp. JC2975 TaxID=2729626 RepID=UPI001473EE33|nr:DUF1697 domain-containing protein [Planctomonas sp. JC2975]NNC12159.1 DUF1697 domain-containing protein [Planctomonas sp. JC2975]